MAQESVCLLMSRYYDWSFRMKPTPQSVVLNDESLLRGEGRGGGGSGAGGRGRAFHREQVANGEARASVWHGWRAVGRGEERKW